MIPGPGARRDPIADSVPPVNAGPVAETATGPAAGSILVVSTYTALLGLRAELVRRGLVPPMPT